MSDEQPVAIVGGGLAGMAAALFLREHGVPVELFEARRALGGRAASFRDPATGELVDFCQHVSMGCCTHLADFCRRAGVESLFRRYRTLHFIGPDNRRYDLAASKVLPAPLHLLPALLRLRYFSWGERARLLRALWRLSRVQSGTDEAETTMRDWLRRAGQSPAVVDQFWALVLVSALGETLDRVTVAAARKVFVDGFMRTRDGYQILVPQAPLGALYGRRVAARLRELGATLHLNAPVERVLGDERGATGLRLGDGAERMFDKVILAAPWRRVFQLLPDAMRSRLPELAGFGAFESSPITGVHLWFDRAITPLPHAVLVGREGDWLFAAGQGPVPRREDVEGYYYQVVISASRHLIGQPRDALVARLIGEIEAVFPDARGAELLHSQVVTEKHAVFSPLPGSDAARPRQETPIAGLFLAGDWTATGWPATMESAVRGGHLAARAVLARRGVAPRELAAEPRPGWLARWLVRGSS